jgi:hypothetical protein
MEHEELIQGIQIRVATIAIGASTVRGQGVGGIVSSARRFLAQVPLQQFGVSSATQFASELDDATIGLMKKLPTPARSWGLARKCLNIFLRDTFYNVYLRDEFNLSSSEEHYEVPLDGRVAKRLGSATLADLPKWEGVKYLTKADSAKYQAFALQVASRMGITRVHLDTFLWSRDSGGAA